MPRQELPGLDLVRLRAHLDECSPGLVQGPLTGTMLEGGRSNLTYVVTDGTGRWVVRRPPLGQVMPTAHDMTREHRVLGALRGTDVPVPGVFSLCRDTDVIGAPFYVMKFVEGLPYRAAAELAALGPERTTSIVNALVDTLAVVHDVDPETVGLSDFGRPEGFLERQLRRWKKQLDASRSRDLPGIEELHDRLAARIPVSPPPAIVHGDYRLDNVLVGADDEIKAVLDWEMSTLGDPLTDLALLIAYSECARSGIDAVPDAGAAPGYPPTDQLIARYARTANRDLSELGWYIGFAFWKLAVIAEGIQCRFTRGQTVGPGFDRIGETVEPLVQLGNEIIEE